MAKGRSHKGQHFIPSSYLSAWNDPDCPPEQNAYVWRFPKEGGEGKRKAAENLFKETDMYTIPMPDGSRNLVLEQGLQQLEQGINTLRRDFLERRKAPPMVRHVKLIAFVSALQHRTPTFRQHQREQWGQILKMGEEVMAQMASKTPEERKAAAAFNLPVSKGSRHMTMDQVKRIVDQPIQTLLPISLHAEVPILVQMRSRILCAPVGHEFITSDNPVVRWDPDMGDRPFHMRSPGLLFPNVQIALPLSPKMALLIHHDRPISKGIKPIDYIDVPAKVVADLNRIVAEFADQFVVSTSGTASRGGWLKN